jgi:hypothetical protein
MLAQEIEKVIITTGQKVKQSGYYVYDGHVEEGSKNCIVTDKANSGLFLAEDSFAPDLGSCPHNIKWRLIS